MSKRLVSMIVLISILAASLAACGTATETPADTSVEASTAATEGVAEDAEAPEGEMLDLASAAETLGVTEEELMSALGDPSEGEPDLEAAAETLGVTMEALGSAMGVGEMVAEPEPSTVTINGVDFEIAYELFTWDTIPADLNYDRQAVQTYTNDDGDTHYYEVVYLEDGNLNWYQAAKLAEDAGGYLASITSEGENDFVFELINDEKYFWCFDEDGDHYGICIGPYLGGYQPEGAEEPDGGWSWLSGEVWDYENWAVNLDDGVIDQDPRDGTQPNDSGDEVGSQQIMGFGEMNLPVATWGDYMDSVGTHGETKLPGYSYAFIIEYETEPASK